MDLADRLRLAREHKGLSQEQLADAVKMTQQAIGAIEIGSTKNPRKLELLAEHLAVTPEWLRFGVSAPAWWEEPETVTDGPSITGSVPLISWVQAGEFASVVDNYHPGDGEVWIKTTIAVRQYTYALRVVGDSMEPEFTDGDIIIVEPEKSPDIGNFVIVRAHGDSECTFKQLVKDGEDLMLKPLNPRYPIRPFPRDGVVVGVVVAKSKIYA